MRRTAKPARLRGRLSSNVRHPSSRPCPASKVSACGEIEQPRIGFAAARFGNVGAERVKLQNGRHGLGSAAGANTQGTELRAIALSFRQPQQFSFLDRWFQHRSAVPCFSRPLVRSPWRRPR